jgi:hypothetical protein
MNKFKSMQALALVALTAILATDAQAHMRMRGPLPKEIIEHSNDIGRLKLYTGLDIDEPSKGLFGLHYYYALDLDAQRLTLKLLSSDDIGAQKAALGIIGHCGGETSDKDVLSAINSRLGNLAVSENLEVRKSALEVKRALRKWEKKRAKKKTARP